MEEKKNEKRLKSGNKNEIARDTDGRGEKQEKVKKRE